MFNGHHEDAGLRAARARSTARSGSWCWTPPRPQVRRAGQRRRRGDAVTAASRAAILSARDAVRLRRPVTTASTRTAAGTAAVPSATYRLQLQPGLRLRPTPPASSLPGRPRRLPRSTCPRAAGRARARRTATTSWTTPASDGAGRRGAFERLADAARAHGLGIVVDVVPNHMAVPDAGDASTPRCGRCCGDGPASPYARWFDIDWAAQERPMLMPVLGRPLGEVWPTARSPSTARAPSRCCATTTTSSRCARAPRTCRCRAAGPAVLPAGALAGGRRGAELPALLRHRHAGRGPGRGRARSSPRPTPCCSRWSTRAWSTGCASTTPTGSPTRAATCGTWPTPTGGAWVVVEKILEGDEALPDDWPCAGTTGYDALLRVGGLFDDPAGAPAAHRALRRPDRRAGGLRGRRGAGQALRRRARSCRGGRPAGASSPPRSARAPELRDHTRRGLREALVELLVAMPVYRRLRRARRAGAGSVRAVLSSRRPRLPDRGCAEDRHGTLDLRRAARPRRARPRGAPRRVRRAVPADLRPGDGQGRRGHRVLPVAAARRRSTRSAATPATSGYRAEEFHASCGRQLAALARRR